MTTQRRPLSNGTTCSDMLILLFVGSLLLTRCQALLVDVHLSLRTTQNRTDLCPFRMALESNLALSQHFPTEKIDFFSKHVPHITLYQVDLDFNSTDELLKAAAAAVGNLTPPCQVAWPLHAIIPSAYAMYPIQNALCLQTLSNKMVVALKKFMHRPPLIPDWVRALPWLERAEALELIELYGSPNVMERFRPHVTVGFDKVASPKKRREVLQTIITPPNCQGRLAAISIARVGVGGSVLQDGILGQIPLYVPVDPNATDV